MIFYPLRRYLHKQVGRPWNKVYSEICVGLKAGHPLHDHLKRHVLELVCFENPASAKRSCGNADLFVDPRTGILRAMKPRRRR